MPFGLCAVCRACDSGPALGPIAHARPAQQGSVSSTSQSVAGRSLHDRKHCMTEHTVPDAATRRLLRALSTRGVWLAPASDSGSGVDSYCIASHNGYDTTVQPFPPEIIAAATGKGWLQQGDSGITLTKAGAISLRRALAGGEGASVARSPRQLVSGNPQAPRRPERRQPMGDAPGLNEAESPLGWLRRRKDKNGDALISDEQFAAGERLRADVFFAGLGPRVTSSWSATAGVDGGRRSPGGGSAQMLDTMIAARQRVDHAMRAVGPELGGILMDVCGFMKGLEVVESEHGWPARSGKVVLLLALDRLAAHYGYDKTGPRRDRAVDDGALATGWTRPRIRHWGADDYRPDLKEWDGAPPPPPDRKPH